MKNKGLKHFKENFKYWIKELSNSGILQSEISIILSGIFIGLLCYLFESVNDLIFYNQYCVLLSVFIINIPITYYVSKYPIFAFIIFVLVIILFILFIIKITN